MVTSGLGGGVPWYLVAAGFSAYISTILAIAILRGALGFGWRGMAALGALVMLVGLFLSALSRLTLGRAYHFMPKAKRLVTHGVYRWFRHPMYIGNQLFFTGAAVLVGSTVGLVLCLAVLLPTHVIRARYEDGVLTATFKDEYMEYKKRTLL